MRKDRSRARAKGAVSKMAVKAEAFEEALSVVSARLATLAAEAAEALRQERLAAARAGKKKGRKGKATPGEGTPEPPDRGEARDRSPIEKKRNAAGRATTRRKQAKRDSRSATA